MIQENFSDSCEEHKYKVYIDFSEHVRNKWEWNASFHEKKLPNGLFVGNRKLWSEPFQLHCASVFFQIDPNHLCAVNLCIENILKALFMPKNAKKIPQFS